MDQPTHPADRVAFATLCQIIETEYVIREQEGVPAPSASNEMLYLFAHNLRSMLRLAIDTGIIEPGRNGFPARHITAYAADTIKRTEAEAANGAGYWDTIALAPRGSMARVLRDRLNLALTLLSRTFRVKALPQPPPAEAAFWTQLDRAESDVRSSVPLV